MSKSQNAAVRLAAAGSTGSNLYNAYQVLAQVGALYVKAQTGERNEQVAKSWTWLSDSALTDLGVMVNIWQSQTREKNPELTKLDQPELTARIGRLCRRIEVFEARCTLWTTSAAYIRILLLCEKHLQRTFKKFSEINPAAAPYFVEVVESGKRRMEKLRQSFEVVTKSMRLLDDNYKPPQNLSDAS